MRVSSLTIRPKNDGIGSGRVQHVPGVAPMMPLSRVTEEDDEEESLVCNMEGLISRIPPRGARKRHKCCSESMKEGGGTGRFRQDETGE